MKINEITQRIVWHSSHVPDIQEFRFLTHLGTWAAAVERALQKDFYTDMLMADLGPKTYMYQVNMDACERGIRIKDDPDYGDPWDHIAYNWDRMPTEIQTNISKDAPYHELAEKLPDMFKSLGIDYLWYYNRIESPRSKSYIALNPKCFKIIDIHAYAPRELLLADPRVIDLQVRRGMWAKSTAQKIKSILRARDPNIKF
jgi:hypothetical protein